MLIGPTMPQPDVVNSVAFSQERTVAAGGNGHARLLGSPKLGAGLGSCHRQAGDSALAASRRRSEAASSHRTGGWLSRCSRRRHPFLGKLQPANCRGAPQDDPRNRWRWPSAAMARSWRRPVTDDEAFVYSVPDRRLVSPALSSGSIAGPVVHRPCHCLPSRWRPGWRPAARTASAALWELVAGQTGRPAARASELCE